MPALASTTENSAVATPTTYYVDCNAPTSGDGLSQDTAWSTLKAVTAHGPFAAGDKILLKRGVTCKGRLVPTGSGIKGSPITIGAFGTSKSLPTVAGGGTGNVTGTIELSNLKYWTVQDLHVTNSGTGKETSAYRSGIFIVNSGAGRLPGITIRRLKVDHVVSNLSFTKGNAREYGGIAVWTVGKKSDGFDDLQILDNTVDHVGRTGITVVNHEYPKGFDNRVRIGGNSVTWARGDSITLFGSKNARIDHNVSAHGADLWPCKQCGKITPLTANAAIWPAASKGVRIDHNEVYAEHVKGGDGEGFDIDASAVDVVLEYNYAHDNLGGGVLFCGSVNAIARFNIFENNAKSPFAFIGTLPAKNTSIYNNTVYQAKSTKASTVRTFNGHKGSGVRFFNNVVYNYATGYWSWPTKVWSRSNTVVGTYRAGEPRGAGFSTVAPRLVHPGSGKNGFASLKGYKLAKGAKSQRGIAIPKSVTTDFFGKKINPKKPPRGAAG